MFVIKKVNSYWCACGFGSIMMAKIYDTKKEAQEEANTIKKMKYYKWSAPKLEIVPYTDVIYKTQCHSSNDKYSKD